MVGGMLTGAFKLLNNQKIALFGVCVYYFERYKLVKLVIKIKYQNSSQGDERQSTDSNHSVHIFKPSKFMEF